ncbi:alpha-hydroxy-acid oxidizing protein [Gemmobacter sp. 24YEA27]|uniref:alpha-hydroxy-acid oxidizing protein n=1 Tax=Gemmobacter sp. 24YEA27 TaxID=3040672 RepID=UPI0024B36D2B|nr:alpha-hydroxy-acid oxidizing protein [Gemmobacter sp. 24YEA27]
MARSRGKAGRWRGAVEPWRAHLTWDKVKALRDLWPGRLVIKGVSDPRDGEIARQSGVDGVVLSNHGGRQLDHGMRRLPRLPRCAQRLARAAS